MEYKCKMINIPQLSVSPQGFIMPICETCKTLDCTNPIEKLKFSIVGVKKMVRVYGRGPEPKFVVECEGYVKNV